MEDSESAAEYREGGLNWRGAFKGGIVSGVTHLLNCTASKTNLLAFDILFNLIDIIEVLCFHCLHVTRRLCNDFQ